MIFFGNYCNNYEYDSLQKTGESYFDCVYYVCKSPYFLIKPINKIEYARGKATYNQVPPAVFQTIVKVTIS